MLNFHNNYIKNKYGEKAGVFAYRYWQAYLLNWNLTFLWRLSYTEFNKKGYMTWAIIQRIQNITMMQI